jgi:hypothetical protein
MDGTGAIEEQFGGELRFFKVGIGELRAIQAKCDAGPAEIARRLARGVMALRAGSNAAIGELAALGLGEWRVDDVREPILQGLIGGGLSPNDAANLVRRWIDERGFRGLVENLTLALELVVAGVAQPEDERLGEREAGAQKATTSRAARSPSAKSTGPARRSASRRATSTG